MKIEEFGYFGKQSRGTVGRVEKSEGDLGMGGGASWEYIGGRFRIDFVGVF